MGHVEGLERAKYFFLQSTNSVFTLVHLVLHPREIAATFLKLFFVVAGGGFYSYYIHQGNKSDKERKL